MAYPLLIDKRTRAPQTLLKDGQKVTYADEIMKVCLVASRIQGMGGIEVTVRQLQHGLVERGFDVDVLTGIPIKIKGLMNPSFAMKALMLVKKVDADIFHAHGGFNMIPLSRARGRKVMTIHGVWSKAIEFLHGKTAGSIARRIESRFLKKVDALTVVSREAERTYKEYHPIYIPNGMDVDDFGTKAKNSVDLAENSVLYIGRLSREKGIEVLLEAWRKVHSSLASAKLYILGSGELQRKVIDYKKFGVEFVGEVSHDDVPNWLCNASLFVLPSVRETGMPMAVLEAMAMKVPVVATRSGGVPDVIINGKTGILIEPSSEDKLSEAILMALTSNLSRIVVNAYERLRRHHSLDECIDAYIKVYEETLQSD